MGTQLCTATVTTNNTVHHLRDGIPWFTLLLLVYETAATGKNQQTSKEVAWAMPPTISTRHPFR